MNEDNLNQPVINKETNKSDIYPVGEVGKVKTEDKLKVNKFPNVLDNIKDVWGKVPEKLQKVLIIVIIFFAIFILFLLILSTFSKVVNNSSTMPTSVPNASTIPLLDYEDITDPSQYALDPRVLEIEGGLLNFEKELNVMQLNEVNLLPPKLDFDIKFN